VMEGNMEFWEPNNTAPGTPPAEKVAMIWSRERSGMVEKEGYYSLTFACRLVHPSFRVTELVIEITGEEEASFNDPLFDNLWFDVLHAILLDLNNDKEHNYRCRCYDYRSPVHRRARSSAHSPM